MALLVEIQQRIIRNRTASEIRSLATKAGGSIATANSVSRLFHTRKGQIIVSREAANEDQLMEVALEARRGGISKADEQGYEILTEPGNFESVHKRIEAKGIKPAMAEEINSLPTITVPLNAEQAVAVNKLIDALEENDDA